VVISKYPETRPDFPPVKAGGQERGGAPVRRKNIFLEKGKGIELRGKRSDFFFDCFQEDVIRGMGRVHRVSLKPKEGNGDSCFHWGPVEPDSQKGKGGKPSIGKKIWHMFQWTPSSKGPLL